MRITHTLIAIAGLLAGAFTTTFGATAQPEFIQGDRPDYPQDARIANVQGMVILDALISEEGKVIAVDFLEPVHPALAKVSRDAVMKWTFKPARKDGEAVMKIVRVRIDFKLLPRKDEMDLPKEDSVALN